MANLIGEAKYGDSISFSVYPAEIIGNDFQYVKLIGMVNASIAESIGLNAYTLHQQVFPLLPRGTAPNSADEYNFIIVEMQNGTKMAIGVPWINLNTLQIHRQSISTVVLADMTTEKVQIVREALAANGIEVVSISLK